MRVAVVRSSAAEWFVNGAFTAFDNALPNGASPGDAADGVELGLADTEEPAETDGKSGGKMGMADMTWPPGRMK